LRPIFNSKQELTIKKRNMKKVILSLAIIALATVGAQAQKKHSSESEGAFKVGVGLDLGIPVSNLDGSSFAIGADVLAEYGFTSQFALTGDIGYTRILAKSGGSDFGIVPLRAGLRVYAAPDFYFGAKIGAGFVSGSGSSFTSTAYSFGAGYKFSSALDLGASYDGYSKNGSIGLINFRLGYTFSNSK